MPNIYSEEEENHFGCDYCSRFICVWWCGEAYCVGGQVKIWNNKLCNESQHMFYFCCIFSSIWISLGWKRVQSVWHYIMEVYMSLILWVGHEWIFFPSQLLKFWEVSICWFKFDYLINLMLHSSKNDKTYVCSVNQLKSRDVLCPHRTWAQHI